MRTQFLACAVFALAFSAAVAPLDAFASTRSEQLARWNERFDERVAQAAREEMRIAEEKARMEARIRELLAQNEARAARHVARVREALCRQLERIERLHRTTRLLPTYCTSDDPAPDPDPDLDPTPIAPTVTFSALPGVLTEGETVALTWDSSHADTCVASGAWSGSQSVDGSVTLAPAQGTHTYTLTCTGEGGSVTASTEVQVAARPVDPTLPQVTFASDEADGEVTEGEQVLLSWGSTGATQCIAAGAADWNGSVATSGSQSVTVSNTATYLLTCANEAGSTTVQIVVQAMPAVVMPTVSLTSSGSLIEAGATARLDWSSTDATVCTASGADDFSGALATSGAKVVAVAATTTYRVTCGNGEATSTAEATVAVYEEAVAPQGSVVISEVYYDVETATRGADPANEWVEVYNASNAPVDLTGWKVGDGVATDTLPVTEMLAPGAHALIVATSATPAFWIGILPVGTLVVSLNSSIGNGLSNTGDAVHLVDAGGIEADAMSYGTNTSVFTAGTLAPADGKSFARTSGATTPFTVVDWARLDTPTPGLL